MNHLTAVSAFSESSDSEVIGLHRRFRGGGRSASSFQISSTGEELRQVQLKRSGHEDRRHFVMHEKGDDLVSFEKRGYPKYIVFFSFFWESKCRS